ncbi:MAG: hypothetical protein JSU66_05465, partial [Deltaproteobacteria bacterium]
MRPVRTLWGRWPQASVPAKVFLFVLVAGLLRLLVVGSVTLDGAHALLGDGVRRLLQVAAQRGAAGIDAVLAASHARVERLAESERLRVLAALRTRASARGQITALLADELATASPFDSLFVLDPDGELVAAAGQPPPLEAGIARRLAAEAEAAVSSVLGPDGQAWAVTSAPLRDRRERSAAS